MILNMCSSCINALLETVHSSPDGVLVRLWMSLRAAPTFCWVSSIQSQCLSSAPALIGETRRSPRETSPGWRDAGQPQWGEPGPRYRSRGTVRGVAGRARCRGATFSRLWSRSAFLWLLSSVFLGLPGSMLHLLSVLAVRDTWSSFGKADGRPDRGLSATSSRLPFNTLYPFFLLEFRISNYPWRPPEAF